MFLNIAVLQFSNTAHLQHKCTFQSRFRKLFLGSGYFNDSFHFYNLLRQTVEGVLWYREQVLYTPEPAALGDHTGTGGAPTWSTLTLGGQQSSAGEAASPAVRRQRAAADLPPHCRRPLWYLELHKLLLPFHAVVHGFEKMNPIAPCRAEDMRRRMPTSGRTGWGWWELPPGGACRGSSPLFLPSLSPPLRL